MNIEAFFNITYGLYIISSGNEEKNNGFIANTAFQVTAEPAQIAIACNKDNLTAQFIQESKLFSISILKEDTKPEIIGLFGYQSGMNVDKFEKVDFRKGKSGVPIVTEDTIAWFECELTQSFDVGTHFLFIGRILNNDLIIPDAKPLTYSHYRNVKKGKAPKNAPTYINKVINKEEATMEKKKYECIVCSHIYDPEMGDPDGGIAPGTAFEDIPDDWVCPVCGASKEDFEAI